jgi:DNA-binding MarR family transcriptional regulator
MTKRLSVLQQAILALCLEQKFMSCKELLELWNLPQEQGSKKDNIAKAEYRSAHAALSRSLNRLWRRGLIDVWKCKAATGTAINLTPEGKRLINIILEDDENG